MRQIHRAGEKLFIDFAGPPIGLTDGSRAHIFDSAMGVMSPAAERIVDDVRCHRWRGVRHMVCNDSMNLIRLQFIER